jgi:hypothetical protein
LSCFFSLEKMDTFPAFVTIKFLSVFEYLTAK